MSTCARLLVNSRRDELLNGPDGDLWAMVAAPVHLKWIKSHMNLEEAMRRGYTEHEWRGNQIVDKAASESAAFRCPKN